MELLISAVACDKLLMYAVQAKLEDLAESFECGSRNPKDMGMGNPEVVETKQRLLGTNARNACFPRRGSHGPVRRRLLLMEMKSLLWSCRWRSERTEQAAACNGHGQKGTCSNAGQAGLQMAYEDMSDIPGTG